MDDREVMGRLFAASWDKVHDLCKEAIPPGPNARAQRAAIAAVLRYVPPAGEDWLTGVLQKQVPIAARMLAAMSDVKDPTLLEEVSRSYAAWLVSIPIELAVTTLEDFPAGGVRAQIGRELVRLMLEADADGKEEERTRPVIALLQLGPTELLEETLDLLAHEDPIVRGHAALIHGYLENDRAADRLMELFENDGDEHVRTCAAKALGTMHHGPALEPMIAAIADPESDDAAVVLDGLVEYGGREAHNPLFTAIEKESLLLFALDMSMESLPDLSAARTDKRVQKLVKGLKSRDVDRRNESASMLGALRAADAEEALIEALEDKDSLSRWSAIQALVEIGARRAIPKLIELLKDRDEGVRSKAAAALGKMQAEEAIEPLLKLVNRKRRSVHAEGNDRGQAALALGVIKSTDAIEPLIKALTDEQEVVRASAAEALGMLEADQARRPLLAALNDDYGVVAADAARALAKLGARDAAPRIARLVKPGRDEEKLRAAVFESLWDLSSMPMPAAQKTEADPTFDALLDLPLSVAAQKGLEPLEGESKNPEAWLKRLTQYSRPGQRSWITETLGKQVPLAASIAASKDGLTPETTAHIADKLTTWIADRSRGLGRRAIEAIPPGDFRELLGEKLARALVSAEERSLPALYAAVIAARTESVWPVLTSGPKKKIYIPGILLELDASRPETLKAVLALLRSRRGATRLSGVQKLARLSGKRVDAALRSALEDSSKKVRAVAGILLAARGDPRGLRHLRLILEDDDADWILREICKDIPTSPTLAETLVGFMDDDEWLVQAHAVRTLGKCKAAEAVPALLDRLENPKWDHRGYAIESLGAIGDRGAVPALMTLLQTDDRWERERAVRALAAIGDERAVPALMDALNDDESTVSAAAVLALADLGAVDAANRILDYLSSDAEGLRSAAAEALGRLGIGRSVERLIERLRDDSAPAVRTAAAKALGAIGDDRAIDLLCDASKDEEWEIAQAAIDALGNFKDPRTRKALTAALESGDSAAAAKSLRRAGDQEAAPALTAIAEGQSRARAEAMEALWEISERLDEPA